MNKALLSDVCDNDITELDCSKNYLNNSNTSNSIAYDDVSEKENSKALTKDIDTKDCSTSPQASPAKEEILLKNTEDTDIYLRRPQESKNKLKIVGRLKLETRCKFIKQNYSS